MYVDGDFNYLCKCLLVYEKIGVFVYGVYCVELEMFEKVGKLIEDVRFDILVLIGYDVYFKGKGNKDDFFVYRYFKYYI